MQDGLTRYVKFLSTPSARRATPRGKQATESTAISIHALREEGDVQAGTVLGASGPISIHALREEGDRRVVPLFGLTLYFYPRPPRGGRPPSQDRRGTTQNFYPRPPRGGRLGCRWALSRASRFLSTPSARRATRRRPRQRPVGRISIHALREEGDEPAAEAPAPTGISIHALREEGDGTFAGLLTCPRYFYPRPPRGGRRKSAPHGSLPTRFLSTPSARRATCRFSADCGVLRNFYPRPPRGGRRAVNALLSPFKPISIHALREEGDHTTTKQEDKNHISIHALREEGDY